MVRSPCPHPVVLFPAVQESRGTTPLSETGAGSVEGGQVITDIMDMLFGCWHTRYSFPLTAKPGQRIRAARPTGTYVACLDCGKEFPYSWDEMKIVSSDYYPRQMGRLAEQCETKERVI